jgi:hypothetical protein
MRISSRKRRKIKKAIITKKYIVPIQNSNYPKSEENKKTRKERLEHHPNITSMLNNDETINTQKNIKCLKLLGSLNCDKYETKQSKYCWLLKKIGICYMFKRYFKKRSRRIYPHLNET